ncbi:PadR family transcriptional regulator [Streptomyces sp. t39]|uniref:PadR family transcriptional regulator n=1 Tax=Streptomyces sp. t39 TaxID=1828156 RepID=UPI0011CDF805|nr:PadR family transcriptional regulator [Streptomyces sp. t39]TXS49858.1 PadR family transcriptional regulator [Streptomyces sp. t39]
MSLPHAILTALLEKPSSGLELTRRFDRSIGYFWSSTHQQIYRELGKLEQAGHIRALPSPQPTRGQKKEYEVLPAGRAELAHWVGRQEDPRPVRDPLLLRLRAAAAVGDGEGVEEELVRHLELHRAQLADYREIERRDFPPERRITREDRLRHVVLRGGIELESFWTAWLTDALAELTADGAGDGPGGPVDGGPAGDEDADEGP